MIWLAAAFLGGAVYTHGTTSRVLLAVSAFWLIAGLYDIYRKGGK